MSPPAPPPPRRFIRVQPHGVQETLHEQTARSVEYLSPPLDETQPPSPPSLPSFSPSQPIPVEEQVLHPTIDQGFDLDDIAPALKIDATLADAGIIDICNNELGFDVIDGDINIMNYINENKEDHLAFKIRHSYYLSKKSQIMKMINKGQAGNSVFYGCSCVILGDWTQGSTWALLDIAADYSESYFNCHHIGLPLRYVRLNDIASILGGTDNYFLIEEPLYPKQIPSFVSDNIITHGLGSSSGVHCQSGQEDFIYEIKRFTINVVDEPNK
jgi:hypothetical protein